MNSIGKLLGLLTLAMLSACGGPTGGGSDVVLNAEPGVNLAMYDNSTDVATNRINENTQARVEIYLTDEENLPIANELVDISASSGALNQTVVLTDDNGRASALIYAPEFEGNTSPGTVSASYQEFSTDLNYEFVASDAPIVATTGILVEMRIGTATGTETNEIPSDEYAFVTFTLLDETGQVMPDKLIDVSVTSGSVIGNTNQVKTDVNGQATIQIESPEITFGEYPGYLTASSDSAVEDAIFIYEFYASNVVDDGEAPPEAGSIQFVGADPEIISLKGTGDLGYGEVSEVTFKLLDKSGNPLSGVDVNFALTTDVGGITLSNTAKGTSDLQGNVSIDVIAGYVATPVRVIAYYEDELGNTVYANSSQLTITSGIPDQNSLSISVETFAPDAWNHDGVVVGVTARVADRYNNPVPDNTTVNFTTEGGSIEGSCFTKDGACSVNWVSQNPRPEDHRATIMAYAVGHESFYDRNGNGIFDAGDDFDDMPEAYLDADEDGAYDPTANSFSYFDAFFDYNVNGSFDQPDGLFNGYPCNDTLRCSSDLEEGLALGSNLLTHVRDSAYLVMSSKTPSVSVYISNDGQECVDSITGKIRVAQCTEFNSDDVLLLDGTKVISFVIEDTVALCYAADGITRVSTTDPDDAACEIAVRQSAPDGTSISYYTDLNSVSDDALVEEARPEFSDISMTSIPNTTKYVELLVTAVPTTSYAVDLTGYYELYVQPPTGQKITKTISYNDPAN